MLSFQPSIMVGSYRWDEERVPRDEFEIRRRALDQGMDEHGWKAMLIYGDAREHAALAYYTNFVPRLRWGLAILPRAAEPLLLCSNGSRDMPSMRIMTWIPDVRSGWEWATHFDPYLAKLDSSLPAELGIIGLELMTPTLRAQLNNSLRNHFGLVSADMLFMPGRALRPREVTLIRESCTIVATAAQTMRDSWLGDKSAGQAALAAERHARLAAAQDVRILVSGDGGRTLAPSLGGAGTTDKILLGYVAVKFSGFWSELFVSAVRGPNALHDHARAGLEAALAALRSGAEAGAVHAAALSALAPASLHPVLSGNVGWRIGLSPDEGGRLRQGNAEILAAGTVYALHVGAHDRDGGVVLSAMAALGTKGAALLCRSPG